MILRVSTCRCWIAAEAAEAAEYVVDRKILLSVLITTYNAGVNL
jgi:hypothetical protein